MSVNRSIKDIPNELAQALGNAPSDTAAREAYSGCQMGRKSIEQLVTEPTAHWMARPPSVGDCSMMAATERRLLG